MYLITFHSNFDANRLQSKLKGLGEVKRKPVPRYLSASCGTCIIFTPDGEYPLEKLMEEDFEGIYIEEGDSYRLLKEKE